MPSSPGVSIGFVGTYAPTVCGIASYTASLVDAIRSDSRRRRLGVVRLTDSPGGPARSPVVFDHRVADVGSLRTATRILNTYDTVSIQHEFGIFGGRDGAEVIDLMKGLTVPVAVTLHTVLDDPTAHQRAIVDRVCGLAQRIAVMSETASNRLVHRYGVDPSRITVIAHGADDAFAGPPLPSGDRPLILTWGLIGPGKGLEWAIEAFTELVDLQPLPRYLIAGATHPQVRKASGETYRDSLVELAGRLGLGDVVEFDNRYLDRRVLARLVRSADVIVLPYESVEQVTSGVLVEAIAASKPVVATPFPHATELLSGGAGALVPFGEPARLGTVLRQLISDPEATAAMTHRARRLAADWYWPTVGRRFAAMMSQLPHGTKSTSAIPGSRLQAGIRTPFPVHSGRADLLSHRRDGLPLGARSRLP